MLEIDGGYGSGGGQILRTALALSILTKKPFKLKNIRAKRENPGLRPQHLACINFATKLTNAYIENAFVGSKEIVFKPRGFDIGIKKIDIGTAGSISLVLQTLMPALIEKENFSIQIIGGTDVKGAPPIDYIKFVLLGLLEKIGYKAEIDIIRRGFYPKGGGIVNFRLLSSKLNPYNFLEKGKLEYIKGNIAVSKDLEKRKVAERIQEYAINYLRDNFKGIEIEINKEYDKTFSPGAVFCLWLKTKNSILGASSLGEPKKSSEEMAKEAVEALLKEVRGVVDSHAADQIMPFLAFIAFKNRQEIEFKTSEITEHAKTNAFIIEKFLPVKFDINEDTVTIKVKKFKIDKN